MRPSNESMRTSVCLALIALGGVAVVAACGEASGAGGEGGAGGGAAAVTYGESECGLCVRDVCAAELDACQTDPGCATYLTCLLGCPVKEEGVLDSACEKACTPALSSEGTRTLAEVVSCRLNGPGATDCPSCGAPIWPNDKPPAQTCEPRPEPAPTPCRQCYWDKCCDTWDACFLGNQDCDDLNTCLAACQTPGLEACIEVCFAAHPASVETILAQGACAQEYCAKDTPTCEPATRDTCNACFFDTCGDAYVAMISTAEGLLLQACMLDCADAGEGVPCTEACFDAHPAAEAAGLLWAECLSVHCEPIC